MAKEIKVRLAQGRDAEAVAGFNVAMALETEGKELSPEVVRRGVQGLLDNPAYGFYVVAETAGEVVGSLMITYEWSDWRCGVFWWIQSVYIQPDYRREGVFTKLYEFLHWKAGQRSEVCGIRLYFERSNETAHAAYAKLQMTETNYGIFEDELIP